MSNELLVLDGISRRFGKTVALDGVSFTLKAGTVHALLGENGAGKTTLMRIAFGLLQPDSGTIKVHGTKVTLTSPASALAHGIGMVHQHFMLVPSMTVAENVALGKHGLYSKARAALRVREISIRTGLHIDPDAQVEVLPVSAQQRCEIIKVLDRNVSILILDEPTSLLAPEEAAELLKWLRRFADDGNAVVLITHKLRDALSIADDFTVLRRGQVTLNTVRGQATEGLLSGAMMGANTPATSIMSGATSTAPSVQVHARVPSEALTPTVTPIIASVEGATVSRANRSSTRIPATGSPDGTTDHLDNVTLALHSGEIVGVAGVEGSGQHALLRLFAGRIKPDSGKVSLPQRIGFIPEDRHKDALLPDEPLDANTALHEAYLRKGLMSWRKIRGDTLDITRRFNVVTEGIRATPRTLSGGNQQKFVVGRELSDNPSLFVAENPTRGLDFSATAAVYDAIRTVRERGAAVLFYSTDLDEILSLSDRVVVMQNGRLHHAEMSREAIGTAMLGA